MEETKIVVFDGKEIELLKEDGRNALTAEQLGMALEYSEPRIAVNKIFNRNIDEFQEGVDYAVTKLVTPGGQQESTLFYLDGIMLISMLSSQPKAKDFRLWARRTLSTLFETGEIRNERTETSKKERLYESLIDYQAIALKAKEETISVYKELLAEKDKKLMPNIDYGFKTYRKWTVEEDEKLSELVANGKTRREIAHILDRTVKSIQFRIEKIIKED